jgi:hypothetical protein
MKVEGQLVPAAVHEYASRLTEIRGTPAGPEILHTMRKKLGIRNPLKSDAYLVAMVEKRLPVAAISALMEHGILEKEIYSISCPGARSSTVAPVKKT